MSDPLASNVSVGAAGTKSARRAHTGSAPNHVERRPALPDWAPWAVLGALLVAGAVGSRVVRAAVASSETAKPSPESAAPASTPAQAPAPKAPASAAVATGAGAVKKDDELRISTQHVVVTHAESIMGRSLNITRTREQAQARATEVLGRARKGEDFRQLIDEYSDDAHKHEFHGEQLNFSRKDAIPSFSQAAFALKVGEISDVVETPFGYMVIRRIK